MKRSLKLVAALVAISLCRQAGAVTFDNTGSLNTAREFHTATLLPNGKVLVAGGQDVDAILSSAELYDSASGTWAATGSLTAARLIHTATLLPNGKVLVAGGRDSNGDLGSAELYDPASGTWSFTGSLNSARESHTATLLPNGKVLVAGGFNGAAVLTSAELYDPASGTWSFTGSLNSARYAHTATLLPNGQVVVAAGVGGSSAELYNPATGSWSFTGSLNSGRFDHTATLLPDGKVLVAGGAGTGYPTGAELYNPAIGTWSFTGSLNNGRQSSTATLLPNGQVLVAGGNNGAVLTSAELYDPASGTWSFTGSLNNGRWIHTATLLPNGNVLVAGGQGTGDVFLTAAELYGTPTATPTPTPTPTPTVQVTVQTTPAGLAFSVDGTSYSSTQTFSWASGSSHTIATTSPQNGAAGIRHTWMNWSGGGAISHAVAPTTNKTYTATFRTQYYLAMAHGTGGTVSPMSGWKNSGTVVSISGTPTSGYSFSNWTGSGAGSYSGTNNPASITMNGPITETASFTHNAVQVTVQTNPAGRSFSVDGTPYTTAQTFSWVPGSSHTIATTSPQSAGTGVQYAWMNWTGGGAISHTVVPTTNTTYTANFRTQYYLTMAHGTGGTVTPASGWKNSGAAVSIRATPASSYSFTNWTGSGTGSFSGTNNPASITMSSPITETATFTHN